MDAGVVGFKLCDRLLQCEECPFDKFVRESAKSEITSASHTGGTIQSAGEQLQAFIESLRIADLARDRRYYTNHTWYKPQNDGSYLVGLDHIAAYLLDSIHCLVLPQTPVHTQKLSPCLWIIEREGAIALQTPFAGIVTSTNSRLKDTPSLVTNSPYDNGWIFSLSPESTQAAAGSLMESGQALEIFHRQAMMLYTEIESQLTKMHHRLGETLCDGGTKVETLRDLVGSRSYFEIISRMLTVTAA
jgi:glycine cleavage system H protein